MDPSTLGDQVPEEVLSREGISDTGRSVLQDIQAYEQILKNPLSYVDRGLLALKYRVSDTLFDAFVMSLIFQHYYRMSWPPHSGLPMIP